jgi:hypothetical protein
MADDTNVVSESVPSVFSVHAVQRSKITKSRDLDNLDEARTLAMNASLAAEDVSEVRIFQDGILVEVYRGGAKS